MSPEITIWMGNGDGGSLVSVDDARVSVLDHGFTVGDGVFETIKVVDGVPFALTRHLHRLSNSAQGLGLPVPPHDLIREAVARVCDTSGVLRLRITWTSGAGVLGSDRSHAEPTLVVMSAPAGPWPVSASIAVVPWAKYEKSAVTGLKTTSYADNVVALAHARALGVDEGIFANSVGRLCEGTGSNVFVVIDGECLTPPLSSGALGGITRELVIEWCGAREQDLPIESLDVAAEIFLTSSTRDVQPVHLVKTQAGERILAAPGPLTAKVSRTFAHMMSAQMDPH